MKGKGKEIFRFLRASPNKEKGFTLLEILVVAFILTVVISALFLTLTTGEFFNSVSSARVDLQSKVRRAMDWIAKDVRQTNLREINSINNNPSANHIKFKLVTGIDHSDPSNYTLSPNYVEYNYDNVSRQLTRSEVDGTTLAVLRSWVFDNIIFPCVIGGVTFNGPFNTAPGVSLAPDDILTSKKLVVAISGQNQVRGSLVLSFSLTEEVKIRNE